MERKKFLKSIGAGAAFALTFPCLHGCSSGGGDEGNIPVPTGVDFTVDLNSSEAANLKNNGGFIIKTKELVVVARNFEGNYIAASQVCSHEGYDQVRFVSIEGGIFYCNVHGPGSKFSQSGEPLNQVDSKTPKPLKIFKTELNGDILRIFE